MLPLVFVKLNYKFNCINLTKTYALFIADKYETFKAY